MILGPKMEKKAVAECRITTEPPVQSRQIGCCLRSSTYDAGLAIVITAIDIN